MSDQPLTPTEARQLVRHILLQGKIRYTSHALREMENDQIEEEHINRALRGTCEEPEWENGQWRYRFHTYDIWVVITFRDGELIIVITAWRKQR